MSSRFCLIAIVAAACASSEAPVDAVQPVRLTVSFWADSDGRVVSSPPGIDCPGQCSADFAPGTRIALTATPTSDASFVGWLSSCGGDPTCNFVLSGRDSQSAGFRRAVHMCGQVVRLAPARKLSIPTFVSRTCDDGAGDAAGAAVLPAQSTAPGGSALVNVVDPRDFTWRTTSIPRALRVVAQPAGFLVAAPASNEDESLYLFNGSGGPSATASLGLRRPWLAADPSGGILLAVRPDPSRGPYVARYRTSDLVTPERSAWLASGGDVVGVSVDNFGRALLMTDGFARFGPGTISARWLDTSLAALTDEFLLFQDFQPGPATWLDASPLIGGGLAIRRLDAMGNGDRFAASRWIGVARGEPGLAASPPPWLVAHPGTSLSIAYRGAAYALVPERTPGPDSCRHLITLVTPDGTSCGSWDFGTSSCDTTLSVGLDGTVIQGSPENNESTQADGRRTCTWQLSPHILGY